MSLANGTEPLVLADGTRIDPATGKVIKDRQPSRYVEVPAATDAVRQITAVRKSIRDLPAPPKQMNAISVVVMYHMFGLSEEDIAIASGMTVDQVGRIKMLDAFNSMLNTVSENLANQETDDVRSILQRHAKNAVNRVIETLDEDGVLGFKAAQDILDRAGHRPVDTVEHRMKLEGGLTIEVVRKDHAAAVPTIDVAFEEIG